MTVDASTDGRPGFDLRKMVDEQLGESESPDPSVVASMVADAVPPRFLREALRQSLGYYVTSRATDNRRRTEKRLPVDGVPAVNRARKALVADRIQEWLAARVNVGTQRHPEWKFRREVTVDEVAQVVAVREDIAAANLAKAAMWREVGLAMEAHGVAKVGDLPPVVIECLIGGS